MKTKYIAALFFIYSLLFSAGQVKGQTNVFILPVEDEIDARAWQHTKQACDVASKNDADLFVIRMNTYGGELNAADSIRSAILRLNIPTVAYIDHNAASAGALIALACDSIFMTPGSSIGAASVVDGQGNIAAKKYQAYMSSMMRSTAERHGKWIAPGDSVLSWRRDPAIAAGMVNPDSVSAYSSAEALAIGFSDGTVSSFDDMLDKLNIDNATTAVFEPTLTDDIIGFLSSSAVRAVLVMLIIGGIYMEMHTPGLGFAAAVALVSTFLYILPMLISGTLASWIVILLVIGIVLVALEIFVIPGFGVCGIAGITAVLVALCASIIPSFTLNDEKITLTIMFQPLIIVGSGLIASIVLVLWLTSRHGPAFIRRHSELMLTQDISDGYIGVDMEPAQFVGKKAKTVTDMRPAGKILLDGNIYDAVSSGSFIDADSHVRILKYENAQLYVEPVQTDF